MGQYLTTIKPTASGEENVTAISAGIVTSDTSALNQSNHINDYIPGQIPVQKVELKSGFEFPVQNPSNVNTSTTSNPDEPVIQISSVPVELTKPTEMSSQMWCYQCSKPKYEVIVGRETQGCCNDISHQ